jgi:sulfite dehydrogenase (quinone) subunit SoeC
VKPALSIIFFTVMSGAGLGLALVAVWAGWGRAELGDAERIACLASGVLAGLLVAAGLLSSLLHLANPRNARFALSRFRTSWLSREGVFAAIFFPLCAAWLAALWWRAAPWLQDALGLVLAADALTVLWCTGMIYASLKPIWQWHTRLTPLFYVIAGLASGSLLFLALSGDIAALAGAARVAALLLLAIMAVLKAAVFLRNARELNAEGGAPDTARATGLGKVGLGKTVTGKSRAQVRLIDAGHTHGTFLTGEFGFIVARRYALPLKVLVFVLAMVLPVLALASGTGGLAAARIAATLCLCGLLVERWLFFAEAKHTVRLYEGQRRC